MGLAPAPRVHDLARASLGADRVGWVMPPDPCRVEAFDKALPQMLDETATGATNRLRDDTLSPALADQALLDTLDEGLRAALVL